MKIIFATGNKGKLREAAEILGPEFELVSPAGLGITGEIEETGTTLEENSLIKAECLWKETGLPCFADDTGLEVDALGGAPGVYTARYAGEGCDFNDTLEKLRRELQSAGAMLPQERKARFRSVVTIITDGTPHYFEGTMEGSIALSKAGCGGFGYDPVFIADEYPHKTVAEIPEEAKNAISHRGKALRQMACWLKEKI